MILSWTFKGKGHTTTNTAVLVVAEIGRESITEASSLVAAVDAVVSYGSHTLHKFCNALVFSSIQW